jgi:hypothetical protein
LQFPALLDLCRRAENDKDSELYRAVDGCKALGRAIKAHRVPAFVFPQVGQHLPLRQIADGLINYYMRTFETVYRVVHVPTFQAEYERYWEAPSRASPVFVILAQLCMAIGACFFDETYTLRSSAMQWIYEAQIWLISPPEKTKITRMGLQVMCLLRFARQTAGVGADLTWISAGSLIRTAMHMGLHRDPQHINIPNRTLYNTEMRRRLWATVLEIVLQSSIDAGGPPLLSMTDFDTEPPGNFDDSQLVEGGGLGFGGAKESQVFSQTSVQIAMLRSFHTRLAIAKFVNDFQSSTRYEMALQLSTELAASCQQLRKQLTALPKDELGISGVSGFQLRTAELATHRFFLALHGPMLGSSFTNPAYYFSRKMCMDTSLKLCQLADLLHSRSGSTNSDFDRLVTSAAGPYRTVVFQSVIIIGLELLARKEEERKSHGLSVTLGGAELRSVLEAALGWTARSIRSGETNCKGHAFFQSILAHIDGLELGLEGKELEDSIEMQAMASFRQCQNIMEMAAGLSLGDAADRLPEEDPGFASFDDDLMDFLQDWEELVSYLRPSDPNAESHIHD